MSASRSPKRRKHSKLHNTATAGFARCQVSGKVGYPKRKIALTVLNGKRADGSPARSIYKCAHCGDYHLTKMVQPS